MKPTQQLPERFQQIALIDLINNQRLFIIMNVIGVGLFLLFGWLFKMLFSLTRPDEIKAVLSININGIVSLSIVFVVLLLILVLLVILHEGIHGLFFWILVRSKPKFAFKGFYAYAAAPEWYIPKGQYMIIAMAPLLTISICGIVLVSFIHPSLLLPLFILLTLNASGSIGDLIVFAWLLGKPEDCLVTDKGERILIYRPDTNYAVGKS